MKYAGGRQLISCLASSSVPKGDARNSSSGWLSGHANLVIMLLLFRFEINEPDKSMQIYRNADERLFAECCSSV